MASEEVVKTVGDLRRILDGKPDDYPIVAMYIEDSGCDTCGYTNEEGELTITDLETRLVFEGRER